MKQYMIVETRDPTEVRDVEWTAALAAGLRQAGARAAIMLAENGVFGARAGADAPAVQAALKAGCAVMAERYALRERGIRESELARGVTAAELDAVVDAMEAGAVLMWR